MLVSAAWILPAAFATINRIAQTRLSGWDPVTARDLLWEGGDWFLYAFLTPGVFVLSKRWPIVRPRVFRRTSFHFGMSLLFCVAWATCGKVYQLALMRVFNPGVFNTALQQDGFWRKFGVDWLSWIFTTLPFGVAVYLCVVGVEHAIRYFVEARDRDVQLARLSEQLAGARFAALQAQVNPHFLFNTLNTIAVFVRDGDRSSAVRILEQLSDVLRITLSSHKANEVTLSEELDLVRKYVAIEHARYSDRLKPQFNIDESILSAAIPSFALQQMIENAIRHGIAREPDAGVLTIDAHRVGDSLVVSVIDDGVGIDEAAEIPKGHGIDNTQQRLRALYGDRASFVVTRRREGGTIATLTVPYHELGEGANS